MYAEVKLLWRSVLAVNKAVGSVTREEERCRVVSVAATQAEAAAQIRTSVPIFAIGNDCSAKAAKGRAFMPRRQQPHTN